MPDVQGSSLSPKSCPNSFPVSIELLLKVLKSLLFFKVEVPRLVSATLPSIKENGTVIRAHHWFAPRKTQGVFLFPFSSHQHPIQCHHDRMGLFI
jgi:hypothetical protein